MKPRIKTKGKLSVSTSWSDRFRTNHDRICCVSVHVKSWSSVLWSRRSFTPKLRRTHLYILEVFTRSEDVKRVSERRGSTELSRPTIDSIVEVYFSLGFQWEVNGIPPYQLTFRNLIQVGWNPLGWGCFFRLQGGLLNSQIDGYWVNLISSSSSETIHTHP